MERRGSGELIEASSTGTPDESSESFSISEKLSAGNGDTSSSKGSGSPPKSICSSSSTSAENIAGAEHNLKVNTLNHPRALFINCTMSVIEYRDIACGKWI